MALHLNRCSCSRLDMTSWQQVAQFVPRVFNHQDCHHNGWVGQWFTKEGLSVWRSQIKYVSASNSLENEMRRTLFPLFWWSRIRWYSKNVPFMNTWKLQQLTKIEINIAEWTKQQQMALRCWLSLSSPCQHIHWTPSFSLSPLPFSSPQPCMLDASASATPVIPLILNRLASATEENPQSGRLLGACSAKAPLIGCTWRWVMEWIMGLATYVVCRRLRWLHGGVQGHTP